MLDAKSWNYTDLHLLLIRMIMFSSSPFILRNRIDLFIFFKIIFPEVVEMCCNVNSTSTKSLKGTQLSSINVILHINLCKDDITTD